MPTRSELLLLLLVLSVVVVACARVGEILPGLAGDQVAVQAPAATPTQVATATPEPTPGPTATPVPQRLGILRFRDDGEVRSGGFQLQMKGVGPAPVGSHYELWMTDENYNVLDLGAFQAGGDVDYSGSADHSLLGTYSGAFVSVEPDSESDDRIGPHAFRGVIPAGSLVHIRHVVFQFPENPDGKGYLIGADEQLRLAAQHTGFMRDQLGAGNLAEARRHAEHVVNIMEGETGPTFGDLDGDGLAQNPGDGFGVRAYVEGAKKHTQFAADAGDASSEVRLHASHTVVSLDNMLNWLDEAIRQAVRVISSDTVKEAGPTGEELSRVVDLMVDGQDLNGDGVVAPVEGEGGLLVAYEHALNMGSFEFFPAETPAGGGASEEEPGANPETVTIEMADLAYQPGDITVPAGATVTWVNKDTELHSATADDGSFDTGLLDPGASASVTFDRPGTYGYYCEMHGAPGGQGMSAMIVVRDNIY